MTLKWVETSKGNDTNPNCRRGWKLRDIKARRKAAQQMEAKDFILERATLGSNFGRTILGLNLRLVQLVLVSVHLCILNRGRLVLPHNGHVDGLLDDALLQTLLVRCWRNEFQNCRSS